MLGLGDILIPGLLLAFAARVDYSSVRGSIWPSHNHGIGYFSILSIGYTVSISLKAPLTRTQDSLAAPCQNVDTDWCHVGLRRQRDGMDDQRCPGAACATVPRAVHPYPIHS